MTGTHTRSAVVTLPSETEILITRDFDAPRRLVWKAHTTPELIERWWSGDRGTVTSVENDLRVGGRWRYVMVANEGFEVAFNGEFREVVPEERIVCTEAYEGAPDVEPALCTYTFTERDGRTTLTVLGDYGTQEVRDTVLATGMEDGMQESYDHLEQVAVSLR